MRAIKTRPRFRCDYCRKTGMAATIERHEPICWQNPDRYCPACSNKGSIWIHHGPGLDEEQPCYWCAQRTVEP